MSVINNTTSSSFNSDMSQASTDFDALLHELITEAVNGSSTTTTTSSQYTNFLVDTFNVSGDSSSEKAKVQADAQNLVNAMTNWGDSTTPDISGFAAIAEAFVALTNDAGYND